MIPGLSNTKLDNEMFLELIKEFRNFIGGTNANNNLLTFMDTEDQAEKLLLSEFFNNLKASENDSENQTVKDRIMIPLLDNTKYAFLIKDIVSGKAFPGFDPKDSEIDLSKTLLMYYEPDDQNFLNSRVFNSHAPDFLTSEEKMYGIKPEELTSMKYTVRPIRAQFKEDSRYFVDQLSMDKKSYTKTVGTGSDPNDTSDDQTEYVKGNFATPIFAKDKVFINGGAEPPTVSSRKKSPGLAAFVIRKPDMGITSRNSDPINIFFNAITPLEMSRCTPYINIAVVTAQDEKQPKQMNNVTFMRFISSNNNGSYTLDENIGLTSAKPVNLAGFDSLFSKKSFDQNDANDVSLMDIFTSTQMTSNADINTSYKSAYANHVLEPISPFLTLTDLSIDISGMGIGLFSSKVASMQLTLHDRSRLSDISNLVAPNQFGLTKVIIEYGWSHPDGAYSSENKIGQFLNSARDRGVFTVKSSNFNFSDGNTVSVSLDLACYGSDEAKTITAAAGSQIPLTVFKPTITRIIDYLLEKNKDNVVNKKNKKLRHKEVRHLLNVSQRNTVSNTSLITYKKYTDLIADYERDKKEPNSEFQKKAFIKSLSGLIGTNEKGKEIPLIGEGEENISKEDLNKRIERAETSDDQNATQLLYGKLYALTGKGIKAAAISQAESDGGLGFLAKVGELTAILPQFDAFKVAMVDFVDNKTAGTKQNAIDNLGVLLKKPDNGFLSLISDVNDTTTLGSVIMSFIGHSLAMSGLFDEVQVYFYPFNRHAAGARKHTTASFPIRKDDLFEAFTKKISKNPNLTVHSVFSLIERAILRDSKNPVYGLDSVEKKYADDIKNLEKRTEELKAAIAKQKEDEGELAEGEKFELNSENAKEKDAIKEVREKIYSERKQGIKDTCAAIYTNDGCPDPTEPVFIRPNISMYMETLTGMAVDDQANLPTGPIKFEEQSRYEKSICRIHIYDEESISKPFEFFLNSLLTEGSAGKAFVSSVGSNQTIAYSKMVDGKKQEETVNKTGKSIISEYVTKVPPQVIKKAVKRSYPSITYGASTGTIKNIRVASNVSGGVSQVLLISSNARRDNPQGHSENNDIFDEMEVVPSTVTVEMMGNPFIQRGNQIYIDFGTNTTLDNIYCVKSVKHAITAGNFSTTVELIFSGQGKVSSIRDKVKEAVKSLASSN